MPHPILKRPQFLRDLEEIFVYLGSEDPVVAFRFLEGVEATLTHIALYPHSARIRKLKLESLSRFRAVPVKGFRRYLIFYRVIAQKVEVVRVLHGARDIPHLLE